MRSKVFSYAIILALIGTLNLTTGCSWWRRHFGKKDAQQTTQPGPIKVDGINSTELDPRPPIPSADSLESGRGQFTSVYFDYDSARIRAGELSKIEAVASAMKGNSKNVIVEGHTDERGTAEYNRALGEKRAGAVREALIRQGIDTSRISTVSYGKEKPADLSQNEAAYAKNRRVEFVLLTSVY